MISWNLITTYIMGYGCDQPTLGKILYSPFHFDSFSLFGNPQHTIIHFSRSYSFPPPSHVPVSSRTLCKRKLLIKNNTATEIAFDRHDTCFTTRGLVAVIISSLNSTTLKLCSDRSDLILATVRRFLVKHGARATIRLIRTLIDD